VVAVALQDSALTGLRAAVWIPLENGVYGLVKLGLLVVVAQTSVTDGLFTSGTLPVLALLVPVNLLLFRRLIPRHAAASAGKRQLPSRAVLTRYLAGGYVGHLAGQASSTFLPVLVVELLGPAQAGFYLPARPPTPPSSCSSTRSRRRWSRRRRRTRSTHPGTPPPCCGGSPRPSCRRLCCSPSPRRCC
jgi:hypothetical protein